VSLTYTPYRYSTFRFLLQAFVEPVNNNRPKGRACFIPVFLLFTIFLYSCENKEADVKKITTKKLGVEEAKNVVINYTLGGKTKSVLKAPLLLRVQESEPYSEFPKTLQADFYNDAGVLESRLTALYAKYKENESVVFLRDSIKIINLQKGDTLYSNELYWDRNRTGREFYTDKPVRIRTKTQILNGVGMESGQDFKNWHIIKSTGIIQVPASKFPG